MADQPVDPWRRDELLPDDLVILSAKDMTREATESTRRFFLKNMCKVLAIGGGVGFLGYQQWQINQLRDRSPDIAELVKGAMPSIVRIDRTHVFSLPLPFLPLPPPDAPDFPEDLSPMANLENEEHSLVDGGGSGFFLRGEKGPLVVTAGHVIWLPYEDRTEGACTVYPSWDRSGFVSTPRAYLAVHEGDVAVLATPARQVIPRGIGLTLRDLTVDPLRQGERVIAIGSPFGLDGTVTDGVISNIDVQLPTEDPLGRVIEFPLHRIQVSVPINEGNSGGPIVDMQGRVVGIATSILDGASGIGFAVRADSIAKKLREWRLA